MKKRLIAFINVLAILGMMIHPVSAAPLSIENWNISYEGSGTEAIDRENNFAELVDSYYYDGDYALVVKYPGYVEDCSIVVENEMTSELPAGKYTVSFFARGSYSKNYTTVGIGRDNQFKVNDEEWTIESDIPGADTKKWKKYTKEIEYAGGSDKLTFIFSGYTNGWDIDSVSVKDESGTEYILNQSFEAVSEDIVSEYDPETYDPVSFITSPFSGGLALSWKNPSTENLKNIELYDITSGEAVLLSDEFSKTPSDFNTYKITKLTNGNVYQYKLHISYRDGNELEYFAYGIPVASDTSFSPWNITYSRGEIGYAPMQVSIDTEDPYEGNACFKVISNIKGSISNVFLLFTNGVTVEQGADYRLSFMAKAKNNKADLRITNSWKVLDGNTKQEVPNFKGTYDWTEFTVDIKEVSTKSINFFFNLDSSFDYLMFDNFSVKKVENGEPVGDNLMKSPDFESLYEENAISPVNGISVSGGDESLNISWKGAGGASKVKLYQMLDGEYYERGYIHPSFGGVTVSNLTNDAEHTFALAGVNDFGDEGELTEVTGSTVAPDFKIYSPKLYSGKQEVEGIQFGTYTVETKLRNNKLDEPVPVLQMVGLYKGDILKKIVSTEILAEKLEPGSISTTLKTSIDVPEENYSDYHLEVFLWNSKEGMKKLYDFTAFGQAE